VEFLDAAALATRSADSKILVWSVGGDKVEEKEVEGQELVFSKGSSREKRLGDHIITGETELVRVQRADGGSTPVPSPLSTTSRHRITSDDITPGCVGSGRGCRQGLGQPNHPGGIVAVMCKCVGVLLWLCTSCSSFLASMHT